MFLANKLNKGAGTAAAPTDAQFNYVTMLLHGDGTNGAQNNTFVDGSTNNFTITRNGNTTQGSFSPYGSGWSNNFDGSNYVSIPSNAAFAFGTGDFTVEGWIFYSSVASNGVRIMATAGAAANCLVQVNTSSQIDFYDGVTTTTFTAATTSANTWTHIAVTRSGTSLRAFINGTQVGSAVTNTTSILSTQAINFPATTNYASTSCYLSNVRYVKGTAVYTSSFTPSTTPLTAISGTVLLTCQSNRFIDNSSNAFVVTPTTSPSVQRFNPFGVSTAYSTSVIGGSGYFDGSGDYLTTSAGTLSGNFTIEYWMYPTSTGSYPTTFSTYTAASSTASVLGQFSNNTTTFTFYCGNGSGEVVIAQRVMNLNSWTHHAIVRSGSTVSAYVNGILEGSVTSSSSFDLSTLGIGAYVGSLAGSYPFFGYISNFRVVNGTAVYTSGFTPPTAPLTAITNTSLLANFTNGAIFDNAMMNDLETVGNAQISTSVKKYGTGSLYFDGNLDGLFTPSTPNLAFGTGDFTVEFWLYLAANLNTFAKVVMMGTTGNCFTIEAQGTANFLNLTNKTSTVYVTSNTALTTGTWIHVAATRASGTLRLFQNGTQVGSAANTVDFPNAGGIYIGRSESGQETNGYIDDLRITKGYARYTANFTPPTAALSDTGPI